jgi:hypothetical protein
MHRPLARRGSLVIGLGDRLVSCLMVTQAARWKGSRVPVGAGSYCEQTYEPRELVMVTADPCEEMHRFAAMNGVGGLHVLPTGATLGELRQLALEEACGEFVATWDDDDISMPHRIARQLEALSALPLGDACVLLRVMVDDQINGRTFTSPRHPWEMTMLARREVVPHYRPEMKVGEDSDSIARMRQIIVLDRPDLYVHVAHAGATVATRLVNEWWEASTDRGAP